MCTDPRSAENQWLRCASEDQIPAIYFLGIAPGLYQAILPVFVADWDPGELRSRIMFGLPGEETFKPPQDAAERRYALRSVKQRLHQASFREAVLTAYGRRCALSGLPEQ